MKARGGRVVPALTFEELQTLNALVEELNMNIRVAMVRRRLRNADLAPLLGLSPSCLSQRLNAKSQWPVKELLLLSGVLGVPLSDLLPTDAEEAS